MMLKAFTYWIFGLWLAVCGAGLSLAQAADTPQLNLQMNNGLLSGHVNGERRIGQGRIQYYGNHLGFQVWSDASKSGAQPNSYVLLGKNNSSNKLRIRIEQKDWQPDHEGGKGIILHYGGESATFDVVIDGDQTVVADHYSLALNAAMLLP
ncbi:AfaD family invasin [Yersinia ruckeri]|uniref:AfaD family invasin n=2 Tax=Yersinia ruckeri TaxID=29486 RepID=UPI0005AC3D5F|nr:AfaD family invasin [Yersinia ruckeri]